MVPGGSESITRERHDFAIYLKEFVNMCWTALSEKIITLNSLLRTTRETIFQKVIVSK
jgi:hypothetical protein